MRRSPSVNKITLALRRQVAYVHGGSIATQMECPRYVHFPPTATELQTSPKVRYVPTGAVARHGHCQYRASGRLIRCSRRLRLVRKVPSAHP